MRGLDGIGVEHPAVIGVVGTAVAALVGDADADYVVGGGAVLQVGFAGGQCRSFRGLRRLTVAPTGSNASQTPMAGMALVSVGVPVSFKACVTMVKVRLPRTGKLNQSIGPPG
jgi:hypothetical protein